MKSPSAILSIMIRGREGLAFQGKGRSLSSINGKGSFDVLPLHANFVCIVKEVIKIIKEDDQIAQIDLKRGVLRVKGNQVEVYLGI